MTSAPRIVKPLAQLRAADLEAHALWDFACGIEGVPGQDETSVQPIASAFVPANLRQGTAMASADFVGPTGLLLVGLVSLDRRAKVWGAIVTDKVCAPLPCPTFWLAESMLGFAEKELGLSRDLLLPLRFRMRLPDEGEATPRSGVFEWRR